MYDIKVYDDEAGGVAGLTDISFSAGGEPVLVSGFDRLVQTLKAFINVEYGSYLLDPRRGTRLFDVIGDAGAESDKLVADVEKTVAEACDYYLEIQQQEVQAERWDDSEYVAYFRGIEVTVRDNDPRWVDISVYPVLLEAAVNASAAGQSSGEVSFSMQLFG